MPEEPRALGQLFRAHLIGSGGILPKSSVSNTGASWSRPSHRMSSGAKAPRDVAASRLR